MKKIAIFSLCLISIALSQCKTSSKVTTTQTVETIGTSTTAVNPSAQPDPSADVAAGESIYSAKCGECHKLPQPFQYNQAEWAHIMIKMSRKSRLSDTETSQVLAFVNSNAKP